MMTSELFDSETSNLNLPLESSDVLTDGSLDEEVQANKQLEFLLESSDNDRETQSAVVHVQKKRYFQPQDAML
ncbi:hypothetical protein TNCV_3691641 [Trichonephila clavipes]|nr:hypothetical protein TNCV_3691641 [Trichonephila clavipes]